MLLPGTHPGRTRSRPRCAHHAPRISPALLVGLGGLFAGVTGPLLSTFVPILVRDALGDRRTLIGAVMAIDNVLLLLLVPLAGALSDRARAGGGRRLPILIAGLVLAAVGMAVFPASAGWGIGGLIAAMVVLYTGINLQRSPLHALRGRPPALALPLAGHRIGDVPDVRRRDRVPDARAGARACESPSSSPPAPSWPSPSRLPSVLREAPRLPGPTPRTRNWHSLLADAWRGRARHLAWPARGVPRHLAAAVDVPDVLDVVRAARHRAVRGPSGGRRHRLHRLGHWRRHWRHPGWRDRRPLRPAHGDAGRVRP